MNLCLNLKYTRWLENINKPEKITLWIDNIYEVKTYKNIDSIWNINNVFFENLNEEIKIGFEKKNNL